MSDDTHKLAALTAGDDVVSGIRLRPFGGGTLGLMIQTDNQLLRFNRDGAGVESDPTLVMRKYYFDLVAYLFIHSEDLGAVCAAAQDANGFRVKVLEWAQKHTIPNLMDAANRIPQIMARNMAGGDFAVDNNGGAANFTNLAGSQAT